MKLRLKRRIPRDERQMVLNLIAAMYAEPAAENPRKPPSPERRGQVRVMRLRTA